MATEMSLKLLVDKKRNKVLFAEAGKEFVDFLFSLFTLPLGTIVTLLNPNQTSAPGSIGKLYSSVDNLEKLHIQSNVDKSQLLQPKIDSVCNQAQTLLVQSGGNSKSKSRKLIYYRCDQKIRCDACAFPRDTFCCLDYVSNTEGALCGCCGRKMGSVMSFVDDGESSKMADAGGGYVKEGGTYMITDDLEVKPMSTISSITFLKRYEAKDIEALEDRVVRLGKEKGLDLLRASLLSKSVLTDVFLLAAKERLQLES